MALRGGVALGMRRLGQVVDVQQGGAHRLQVGHPVRIVFADPAPAATPGGLQHGLQLAGGDGLALGGRMAGGQHPPVSSDDGGRDHRGFAQHAQGDVVQRRLVEGEDAVVRRHRQLPRQQLGALLQLRRQVGVALADHVAAPDHRKHQHREHGQPHQAPAQVHAVPRQRVQQARGDAPRRHSLLSSACRRCCTAASSGRLSPRLSASGRLMAMLKLRG